MTVTQEQNYNRVPLAYLPRLEVKGQEDPVVQVIDEYLGEIVYTLRINGMTWRPKVFKEGTYTLRIGEGESVKVITGVESIAEDDNRVLTVAF